MKPWFKVDLRVMAMKEYTTFLRSPEVDPHHQMRFSVISKTPPFGGRSYSSSGDTVNAL